MVFPDRSFSRFFTGLPGRPRSPSTIADFPAPDSVTRSEQCLDMWMRLACQSCERHVKLSPRQSAAKNVLRIHKASALAEMPWLGVSLTFTLKILPFKGQHVAFVFLPVTPAAASTWGSSITSFVSTWHIVTSGGNQRFFFDCRYLMEEIMNVIRPISALVLAGIVSAGLPVIRRTHLSSHTRVYFLAPVFYTRMSQPRSLPPCDTLFTGH